MHKELTAINESENEESVVEQLQNNLSFKQYESLAYGIELEK